MSEMLATTSSSELAEWFAELRIRAEDHEKNMEEIRNSR